MSGRIRPEDIGPDGLTDEEREDGLAPLFEKPVVIPLRDDTITQKHWCGYPEDTFACRVRHLHISPAVGREGRAVPPFGEVDHVEV